MSKALYEAINRRDIKEIRELVKQPEKINFNYLPPDKDEFLLTLAIQSGDQELIDAILSIPNIKTQLNDKGEVKRDLIDIAAKRNDLTTVLKLMQKGAAINDLEREYPDKIKPLFDRIVAILLAINLGDTKSATSEMEQLAKIYPNPNNIVVKNSTFLSIAAANHKPEMVKLFIRLGGTLDDHYDDRNYSILTNILSKDNIDDLKFLLKIDESRKQIYEFQEQGKNILHFAFKHSASHSIAALLENAPKDKLYSLLNAVDESGMTPLHYLISEGKQPLLIKYLSKLKDKERMESILQTQNPKNTSLLLQTTNDFNTTKELFRLLPPNQRLSIFVSPENFKNGVLYKLIENQQWDSVNNFLKLFKSEEKPIPMARFLEGTTAIYNTLIQYFPQYQSLFETEAKKIIEQTTVHDLFLQGDAEALLIKFKDTVKAVENDPKLAYGPLAKSRHTQDLEKLTRYLLNNIPVEINKRSDNLYYALVNTSEGIEEYNLSEILQFANPQHIQLFEEDLTQYDQFLSTALFKDDLTDESTARAKDVDGNLKDLSFSEMRAINIYTSNFYSSINNFISGNLDEVKPESMKEAFLDSVVALSGLNKMPYVPIRTVYRSEKLIKKDGSVHKEVQARLEAAQQGGLSQYRQFISTSFQEPYFKDGDVLLVLQDVFGKNVASISQHPTEREILIPPGQVEWSGYVQVPPKETKEPEETKPTEKTEGKPDEDSAIKIKFAGKKYLLGKPKRTLSNLPEEAQRIAQNIPFEILNHITTYMHILWEKINELQKIMKAHGYNEKYIDMFTMLNHRVKILLEGSIEMLPEEKLNSISDEFDTIVKSIQEDMQEGKALQEDMQGSKVKEQLLFTKLETKHDLLGEIETHKSALTEKRKEYEVNRHFGAVSDFLVQMSLLQELYNIKEDIKAANQHIYTIYQNSALSNDQKIIKLNDVLETTFSVFQDFSAKAIEDRNKSLKLIEGNIEKFPKIDLNAVKVKNNRFIALMRSHQNRFNNLLAMEHNYLQALEKEKTILFSPLLKDSAHAEMLKALKRLNTQLQSQSKDKSKDIEEQSTIKKMLGLKQEDQILAVNIQQEQIQIKRGDEVTWENIKELTHAKAPAKKLK